MQWHVNCDTSMRMYIVDVEEPATPWLRRLKSDTPRINVYTLPLGYRAAKRLMDIVGALVLAVVLMPVWCLVPLLIKLTSGPGPIIYRQTRVGLNRRVMAANDTQVWSGVNQRTSASLRSGDSCVKPELMKYRS